MEFSVGESDYCAMRGPGRQLTVGPAGVHYESDNGKTLIGDRIGRYPPSGSVGSKVCQLSNL